MTNPAPPDLGLLRILRDDATADPALDPGLSDADLVLLLKQMLLIRTLDERCLRLQRQGRIAFYGSSTGQEAATVGSAFTIGPDDWLFPALREGGAALLRGMPVSRYIAQLMGNAHDEEKGHQQPMHFSWRAANHVSLSSPIGTQVPQAVGCARAMQIAGARGADGQGKAVLAYIGDGGTSEPDFHVAMTFAGVWKCPVVVFCQNNGWAISVPTSQQTASQTIAVKARGYGIPGIRIDGNDILAVVKTTRDAVEHARRGNGPTFIEAVTYRRHGHSSSDDPNVYRNKDEVGLWEKRDPIDRFRAYMTKRRLWSKELEFAEIEAQNALVTREIQEAEKSSPPPLETLIEDVTEHIRPELREQLAEVRPHFEEGKTAEGAFPL